MNKIMLIEDEKKINIFLKDELEEKGYLVDSFYRGTEALDMLFSNKYDLIILDWMLPDIEGIDLIGKIRDYSKSPVIMITAKSNDEDEIRALNMNIEDYIRKPFNIDIFLLRVGRVLEKKEKIYRWRDLELNTKDGRCSKGNSQVKLSPREYNLLLYFFEYPNQLHSREKLLDYVWGYDFFGDHRTVDTHVKMLRKKFGKDIIKTKRKLGYIMEVDHEDKE